MKRTITKLAVLVLVFAMLLTLSACGSDKKALLGKWEADLDFTDTFNAEMEASMGEEMMEYFQFPDFEITMVMEFRDDDTYSMSVNEDNLYQTMDIFKQCLREGLENYMEDLIASQGLEMSVEEVLAASGTSIDDLMNEAFSDDMIEALIEGVTGDVEINGKFKAMGGKLFMTDSTSDDIDETMYDEYVLEGDTLTLVTSNIDDDMEDLYPIEFERVD